jgi:hypothetical protein
MANPNYIHTITLYNCLRAADTPEKKDIWYRQVLSNCFYKAKVETAQFGTGIKRVNIYTVRIPESMRWLPYKEWAALQDSEREEFFTANTGDIVVYGESEEEITSKGDGAAARVLERNAPSAFRVTAVTVNTGHSMDKHYRLEG